MAIGAAAIARGAGSNGGPLVYAFAVLSGAVLLFQVQPIAGKLLLPLFGGGASVWTACLCFFQAMLLAGYAYAYLLTRFAAPRRQAAVHALVVVASALPLPLGIAAQPPAAGGPAPAVLVWTGLLASVGPPFVALAGTAPLLQRWASITRPGRSPWRLYALSNTGALLALLSYPVFVEPHLRLGMQTLAWSGGYVLFAVLSLAACRVVYRRAPLEGPRAPRPAGPPADGEEWAVTDGVLTFVLAVCGVVALLAATNQITQNVAPIPFLWILPLAVYLVTFIVCFGGERWYDRAVWGSFFVVAASSVIVLEFFGSNFGIVPVVSAWLLALFFICMLAHGELYRLRPPVGRLGAYYLLIAAGGAAGGLLVSLVAPLVFVRYWEGLAGVYVLYLILGLVVVRDARRGKALARSRLERRVERLGFRLFAAGWTFGVFLFPGVVFALAALLPSYDVASTRNFYGTLNVRDVPAGDDGPARRLLVDGTTIHGFQLLDSSGRNEPTSYYARTTGIGAIMRRAAESDGALNVGVVGLGAGTLAAYGRPGDRFRFYELNPAVVEIARKRFSYLADSAAEIDIVTGDGRISLARELRQSGSRRYDVLVVDAFSSDAIPVHLLTREAQELYWAHLEPGGILAFHVTNNYLNLATVIAKVAFEIDKTPLLLTTASGEGIRTTADWVAVTAQAGFEPGGGDDMIVRHLLPAVSTRVWTDDYSDPLGVLR